MVNVVVVGGGFAGLSAAARLAKLRHHVTLVEATDQLGGRLRGLEVDGRRWAADPETVTLPGVLRDLFRKSGRQLDRVLDLTHVAEPRRHLFDDQAVLDLPLGDRAAQHDAVVAAFGTDDWSPWVDEWNVRWDVLRRTFLDRVPAGRGDLDRAGRRALAVRRSVDRLDAPSRDERLEKMIVDAITLQGQDVRTTPALEAVEHYVERNFGRWRIDGGLEALADALQTRLAERKVHVVTGEHAHRVVIDGKLSRSGRVRGVATDHRVIDADVVVWCAPTWPAPFKPPRALPAIPASRTFATLRPGAPALPRDLHVHTELPMRLFHSGTDADGSTRVTIVHRDAGDPLATLRPLGLDLAGHVIDRVRLSPADLVGRAHWGWRWAHWSTVDDLPGIGSQGGLHFAGAHAWSGGTIERIGMATAAIAEAVGAAPR